MSLDDAKNIGQIAAWIAAAAYFVYKLISGYWIGSASLRLTCTRTATPPAPDAAPAPVPQAMDYLSVLAVLKRGTGATTLVLHDARARVFLADGKAAVKSSHEAKEIPADIGQETRLISAKRLSSKTVSGVYEIMLNEVSQQAPLLNLAPGDEMQFATVYKVPRNQPCVVEVAIMGRSWLTWKRSQWRASDISLPVVE